MTTTTEETSTAERTPEDGAENRKAEEIFDEEDEVDVDDHNQKEERLDGRMMMTMMG